MINQYFSSNKNNNKFQYDSSSKKKSNHQIDRFIPHSVSKNLYSIFKTIDQNINKQLQTNITTLNNINNITSKSSKKHISYTNTYTNLLQQNIIYNDFQTYSHNNKLLHFGQQPHINNKYLFYDKQNNLNQNNISETKPNYNQKLKKISKQPYKILDAPLLKDDFYLNLLDWSDSNLITAGLLSQLYIWSGCQSKVQKIYQSPQNLQQQICSVSFMRHNPKISISTNQGHVKILDIYNKNTPIITMNNIHTGRIGSLGCTNNLIVTGGKDGYVSIHDIRMTQEVFRYKAHHAEISGLKISPNNQFIATGGNDNKLLLFSLKMMDKVVQWGEHKAAVKAIGFNPHHASIASGGGTADKKIRIFSLNTFEKLSQTDTGSQICNLRYSPISNQMVTTHGYSLNQIILWKYDQNNMSLKKVDSLMGHKNRVLYLAGQSQGGKIVTGAGDQELRFWKVFSNHKQKQKDAFDLR